MRYCSDERDNRAKVNGDAVQDPEGAFKLDLPPLALARVSGEFASVAVRTAQEFGADPDALGRDCGLGDLTAPLPDAIGVANFLQLLEAASTMLGDPLFGLHVGERMRVADAGGYGMALLACANFRETVAITLRYESLAHDLGRSQLIERDGIGCFRWRSPWLDLPGGRHLVEFIAADIRAVNNWLAGFMLPVASFNFTHEAPPGAPLDEYQRVLAAPVNFAAAFNEGLFPAALLDLEIPNADRSLLPHLTRVIDKRLAEKAASQEAPAMRELRTLIRVQMMAGRANLVAVAAAAGVSPRTLQRRFADGGGGFSSLLDAVRRETAEELLADPTQTLADVALLLGFSEQSSFNHAFRRWFGASPLQWRRRTQEPGH